mmetsp:Transcript_6225/g.10139  ORF Transcript_6225/g.10139 Transcript_6225/m.10139 type:complete len:105 (+) Transcript_6225:1197-1511(+)
MEKRNAVNKKTYRFNFTISDEDLASKIPKPAAPAAKPVVKPADGKITAKAGAPVEAAKKTTEKAPAATPEKPVVEEKKEAPPPEKKAVKLESEESEFETSEHPE